MGLFSIRAGVGWAALIILLAVAASRRLKDQPHPDVVQKPAEPRCTCEYVDVLPGVEELAAPDPDCDVHSLEMLAAMTYRRHTAEREMGIEAVRAHWAHNGCSCGCGGAA